jgi:hypothetical protein
MKQGPGVAVAVGLVLAAPVTFGSAAVLRSVRVSAEAGASVVVIEADGPLPTPVVGVVETPPRIYLDFDQVTPATRGLAATGDPLVRRVRIALNRSQPPVTRVVIDLTKAAQYRIEADASDLRRVTVIVGAASDAGGPPAAQPPAPPPQTETPQGPPPPPAPQARPAAEPIAPAAAPPPAPAPPPPPPARAVSLSPPAFDFVPSTSRAPAKDVERYLRQASVALDHLDRLRPLLTSLDAQSVIPEERLRTGVEGFEAARRVLAVIEPPPALRSTHDLFKTASVLGAMSARTRLATAPGDDATGVWTAASAAAGALLLLDRARAELGPPPPLK